MPERSAGAIVAGYAASLLAVILAIAAGAAAVRAATPEDESAGRVRFGVVCPWGGLGEMGIGMVRTGAGATALGNWSSIHRGKGVFDWKASDQELYGVCAEEALQPLPILGYTPGWLSTGKTEPQAHPPADYLAFDEFAHKAVLRYKQRVRAWEVWNEPDIGFWKGTIPEYVDMLKTGSLAIRAAHSSAKVVFGGLAGANVPYLKQAYGYGAGPFFDVMAVHPYQWGETFNDEWFVSQLVDVRAAMNRHGDSHKPIWLTEFGWSTADAGITQEVQARLLVQGLATALTLERIGVEKVFWFCVKDWGGPGYGLLDTDGRPRTAYRAYSELIRRIGNLSYAGSQDAGPNVRFHVFRDGGGHETGILWSADKDGHPAEITVAPGLRNVRVTGLLGDTTRTEQASGERVHLIATPEPQYLTGRFRPVSLAHQSKWPVFAARKPAPRREAAVWMTAHPRSGTARPYVVVGETTALNLVLQNRSVNPAKVEGTYRVRGVTSAASFSATVPARGRTTVPLAVRIPAGVPAGLRDLIVTAEADGQPVASLATPVRLSRGEVVEFLANSALDERYLTGEERGGGAPSVRFGNRWTYRIPIAAPGKLRISALVGAHNSGPWSILASDDGREFHPLLSGRSGKGWHHAVRESHSGVLWLRFEGTDVQLGEVVIESRENR